MKAFETAGPSFAAQYAAWQAWAASPAGTLAPRMESNTALAKVAPALEEAGYAVEKPGAKLPLTVLRGPTADPRSPTTPTPKSCTSPAGRPWSKLRQAALPAPRFWL